MVKSSIVPIPPSLAGLPVIKPEPWLQVDDDPHKLLEGPAFDREGNLFITSIFDGRVLKITPDKKVAIIFDNKAIRPDGTAIHKDGRLFAVCLSGEIIAINTDGSNVTCTKVSYKDKPICGNDIVFDSQGNFYVTDFTGTVADPTGGVYRFSPDLKTIEPVIQHLASPNGVALSPKGNILWVSETCRNEILRVELMEDGINISPIAGVTIPYRFTGGPGGPDSIAVDMEGNVYQCLIHQGRILILNKRGFPIAHVLVPGRDEGQHLMTPNLAFKPGTDEAFMIACGEGGAWVYKFNGLAKGLTLFSHQ